MAKFIRIFFKSIFFVTLIGLVTATVGLAVARAQLPASACVVTETQVDALQLEKMSYADVKSKLGCEGVLKQRQDYGGKIVIEDYAWRGDAWPYAHFQGHFINGVLHGTDKRWLALNLTW